VNGGKLLLVFVLVCGLLSAQSGRVASRLMGLTMLGAASLVIFKGAGFDFN